MEVTLYMLISEIEGIQLPYLSFNPAHGWNDNDRRLEIQLIVPSGSEVVSDTDLRWPLNGQMRTSTATEVHAYAKEGVNGFRFR